MTSRRPSGAPQWSAQAGQTPVVHLHHEAVGPRPGSARPDRAGRRGGWQYPSYEADSALASKVTHYQEAPPSDVSLPSFSEAPVVEVALAVAFEPLALRSFEIVRIWDALFLDQFPHAEEQPPFQMPIEQFASRPEIPSLNLQLMRGMPVPRLVLHNDVPDASTQVIQLQNNHCARNWRKSSADTDYPRYPALQQAFAHDLERLQEYLLAKNVGTLRPVQCELTYINHIASPPGTDLGDVLTIVARRPRMPEGVPEPDAMRVGAQYVINQAGGPVGRVHVSADPAARRKDGSPIILLNVTARGRPLGDGLAGALDFLALAHGHAVRVFEGITRPEMHRMWGGTHGT